MYETIKGELIDGEITAKLEKTMVVLGVDGYTHLCKLVGEGVKQERRFIIKADKPGKNEKFLGKNAIRVVYPDGEYEDFQSMQIAGECFKVSRHAVSKYCNAERTIKHGRFKGYQFIKL